MNKAEKYWVLGHEISPLASSGNYDIVIGVTPANMDGPPPHNHSVYHELFHVLEGEMDFVVDGKPSKIEPGETVDLQPGMVHTFRNSGATACKWINIHSPKGFFAFFKAMGIPAEEDEAMKKSVAGSVIEKVIAQAADFDMHIRI